MSVLWTVKTQTYYVYQLINIATLFSTVNYLADNFSENVNESKSKFERVVFELFFVF